MFTSDRVVILTVHPEQSVTKICFYQNSCQIYTTSQGSIGRDNKVILQCLHYLAIFRMCCSLGYPGYMHLKFQPLSWTTRQPRAFELCLGSSFHQSEYQIYIVRFPGGVRALDSAIIVNKNLALG